MTTATVREKNYLTVRASANGPKYEPTNLCTKALDNAREALAHVAQVLPARMAELATDAARDIELLQEALATGKLPEQAE